MDGLERGQAWRDGDGLRMRGCFSRRAYSPFTLRISSTVKASAELPQLLVT